ncbi:FAD-dependent oxidoreductase [Salinisphaera sp. G21_0]|uniref:flavin monoamine oxidase family protein n=1 Tax=Salinisphaera sp. G21_0 TaxID=2821094 RepID=UPI001AD9B35B|nr:FAD-dependent oxidoreductase [Salinisphaera sp. G21_0]MBO9483846.1 FAD-dependent oxidoreductase [Salinisphaera sp. G21_0]
MVVNARHAILGLPKRSLELLDQDSVLLRTPEIWSDIDSVISKPAIKLYLGYPYPWWKVLGIRGGKSVTDLQIKQSYYFGTEEDRPAGEAGNTNALLLAAYTDGRVLDYWHPLARGNEFAGAENPFVPVGQSPLPNENRATNNQVMQAQKELKALHDLKYIPKPYTAAYMDWSQDPYGGGYSLWKPGQKSLATQKRMRHLPGLPIHICGDSYSDLQGWVEGALTSTELMLEEHFQLCTRAWLIRTFYLPSSKSIFYKVFNLPA